MRTAWTNFPDVASRGPDHHNTCPSIRKVPILCWPRNVEGAGGGHLSGRKEAKSRPWEYLNTVTRTLEKDRSGRLSRTLTGRASVVEMSPPLVGG